MHPVRMAALPLAFVLVLSACTGSPPASVEASAQPSSGRPSFAPEPVRVATLAAYDPTLPLDLREESEVRHDAGIEILDVSWVSPHGGRASAWLVVPSEAGPHAGIVYLHGSETWRDDFLDEAIAMAHGGAVSIVIDAPFARTGADRRYALQSYDDPEEERAMTAQAIVDVRRAFDVLLSREDVDPERLGFVGHSWGASLGVPLAAVDQRPGSLVLISGRPSWTGFLAGSDEDWVARERDRAGEAAWQRYLELMAPLDAMAEIANVDGSRIYFQYGRADAVVPEAVARQLMDAAPLAEADLYDAGHALNDAATADRIGWLVERLDLDRIELDVIEAVGLPDG